MLITEMIKTARDELRNILEGIGFVDGANLQTDEQIRQEEKIIYWSEQVVNPIATQKDSYIVYNFLPYRTLIHGDNKSIKAEMIININFFTTSLKEAKNVYLTQCNMEKAFIDNEWIYNLQYESYDNKSKLYQYTYMVKKLYG